MIKVETKKTPVLKGIYESMNELIGFDNVLIIYNHFKGSQVNFPTRLFSKEFVLKETLNDFDGTSKSINQLANKYFYSERTLRKMIKSQTDKK